MALNATQLRRRLEHRGLPAALSGRGHVRITCPNGQKVMAPATPSDHRAMKNVAASLRRNGVDIHWRELV
jgi:hypothetical protein